MKRKTAKKMLAESFRELAEKKPVDKITVQDIIDNCGYSKTTFYRSFKDKYDLMAWAYIKEQEEIIDRMDNPDYEWKTIFLEGAFYSINKGITLKFFSCTQTDMSHFQNI